MPLAKTLARLEKREHQRNLARLEKREHQRKADQFAEAETGIPAHMVATHLFALRILAGEI